MSEQTEMQEAPVTEGQQTQAPSETQPVEAEQPVPVAPFPVPVEVAPQPTEPVAPQYLTRDELTAALEQRDRQFQSRIDKAEYRTKKEVQDRLKFADQILQREDVSDYFGDDAAQVRRSVGGDLVADYFRQEQPEPQEPAAPALSPDQAQQQIRAQSIMETVSRFTGINPGDQDYVDPNTTQSAEQWTDLMKAAAQRRSNSRQPQPTTPPPAPAPPPAEPPEVRSAPVTMGTGEAPRKMTPAELSHAHRKAVKSGDRAEAARLGKAIDDLMR